MSLGWLSWGSWVMGRKIGWGVLGGIAGLATALAVVIAVEAFSMVVHPFPPEFDQSPEQVCEHVRRYPAWVLAVVIPLWSGAAASAAWVSRSLGGRLPAVLVAGACLGAVALNLWMLPYPGWFQGLVPIGVLAAGIWGGGLFRPRCTPSLPGGLESVTPPRVPIGPV